MMSPARSAPTSGLICYITTPGINSWEEARSGREHKAAGCRDRKGGGELPEGSRKWQGRGWADHRLMGKVIQISGNWIWHLYNSVCWLKVDTLELFPKAAQIHQK